MIEISESELDRVERKGERKRCKGCGRALLSRSGILNASSWISQLSQNTLQGGFSYVIGMKKV